MRVYFIAAISQISQYEDKYKRIVKSLESKGHQVQSDHIFSQSAETILTEPDSEKIEYYKKFLKWLNQADIVVAEASFPSTVHVGHEISLALEKGKPVIVLYEKGKAPVFLQGIENEKLILEEYTDSNLEDNLLASVGYASEQQDTRFNFFISPKHQNYLDWISKNRKIPRAVYLRRLIEKDMEENDEYND